jgi:hypothetical protein
MANNFFFSEDGLTFIDLSQISAIAKKSSPPAFYVYLRNVDRCIVVDSDTVTELFDAMHEYGIGE